MAVPRPIDWKLIFLLSLFGLFMGIATVFFIPSRIEPFCWLLIFLICAYVIARSRPTGHFVHGLLVSLVNSVWITGAHALLFHQYIANHPAELEQMQAMPLGDHALRLMLILGPFIGLVSGLILGLFAFIAGKLVKSEPATVSP